MSLNVIRLVLDNAPKRLSDIDKELEEAKDRITELVTEKAIVESMLKIAESSGEFPSTFDNGQTRETGLSDAVRRSSRLGEPLV